MNYYIKNVAAELVSELLASRRRAKKKQMVSTILLGLAVAGGISFVVANLLKPEVKEVAEDAISKLSDEVSSPKRRKANGNVHQGTEELG